jgi:HD domain
MLSVAEAQALVERHLRDTPRATHTRVVAYLMRWLAGHFSEDGELWEVVGLCHDLDYFATADDRTRHGLLAVSWLGDRLPEVARQAIAAHDHRTGVHADTRLADLLKAADAAAVIDHRLGRDVWTAMDRREPYTSLRGQLREGAYLSDILQRQAMKHALPFDRIVRLMAAAPPQ